MITPIIVPMQVAVSSVEIPMQVAVSSVEIPMTVDAAYQMVAGDEYEGPYEVTPSGETQVLNTKDKLLLDRITINPIPSNYGLITWNGSTLTVS